VGPDAERVAIALLLGGLAASAAGVLRIVAGVLNLTWRGRRLGLVALTVGLVSIVTCCCLPTTVALFAYGNIVYWNPDVRRAFERRGQPA
jgi:hypothetical protein